MRTLSQKSRGISRRPSCDDMSTLAAEAAAAAPATPDTDQASKSELRGDTVSSEVQAGPVQVVSTHNKAILLQSRLAPVMAP